MLHATVVFLIYVFVLPHSALETFFTCIKGACAGQQVPLDELQVLKKLLKENKIECSKYTRTHVQESEARTNTHTRAITHSLSLSFSLSLSLSLSRSLSLSLSPVPVSMIWAT